MSEVPCLFKLAGEYYKIFDTYYFPFTVIFMIAGVFALAIQRATFDVSNGYRRSLRYEQCCFIKKNGVL